MNCVKLRNNGDIPLKNRADVLRWQKVYDLFHFIFRQKLQEFIKILDQKRMFFR